MKKIITFILIIFISLIIFQSCKKYPAIRMAEKVDLNLYMGDWYVIANIPTFIEKGAHNAIESYRLQSEGIIDTRFTFNKDSLTGPKKEYNPTGFVTENPSNAEWKMQFLWPFKSEFIIVYVDPEYQFTIIGRTKRDYVWIMARSPDINKKDLDALIKIVQDEGYDVAKIQRIPHNK